ncbi:hypothetical protein ACVA51_04050 [Pseudomonas luteola]
MWMRMLLAVTLLTGLSGCESYHDQLVAKGYPPPYADGYHDGCLTGKQAVNGIGALHKNVPRYDQERYYAQGWEDGYRQCASTAQNEQTRRYYEEHWSKHEEDWERSKRRGMARALRGDSKEQKDSN